MGCREECTHGAQQKRPIVSPCLMLLTICTFILGLIYEHQAQARMRKHTNEIFSPHKHRGSGPHIKLWVSSV